MRSQYGKSVITMLGGTTAAQAIPVLVTPILSRLFEEEAFGALAGFVAIGALLAVISTGRYELAINLPREDERGKSLLALSLVASAIFSVLVLVAVLIAGGWVAGWLGLGSRWLLLLLPVYVLGRAWMMCFSYWLNRRERFGQIATGRVMRAGSESIGSLGAGASSLGAGGLMSGTVLGQAVGAAWLGWQARRDLTSVQGAVTKESALNEAREYRDFPRFSLISDVANIAANQAPLLLMTALFGPVIGGLYYMTQRVLAAPIAMVGVAFGDVFKQRAAKDYAHTGSCRAIYVKTLKHLALLSFVPFLLVALLGPWLFAVVLGEEWREAGVMARLLAPMYFVRFCVSPLGQTLYIAGQQRLNMFWQLVLTVCTVGSVLIGWTYGSVLLGVGLLSGSYGAMYLIYLWLTWRASDKSVV